ncbi:MAG: hypothetical protein WCR97_04515 [Bacilli bacterium]
MNKNIIFWQTYLNLENDFISISKVIFITDAPSGDSPSHQLDTYSPLIADLLVRICIEIESITKDLYKYYNGPKSKKGYLKFDYDCIPYLDNILHFDNKTVNVVASNMNLTQENHTKLLPFKIEKYQDSFYLKNYQAVKHNRYENLEKGNIESVLNALSALFLLNIYLKNEVFSTSLYGEKINMSFGSKVFCLDEPNGYQDILNVEKNVSSSSPYVINYTKESHKRLEEVKKKETTELVEYLLNLPYFKDDEFEKIVKKESPKWNRNKRFNYIYTYYKYYLSKIFDKNISYEEKKQTILNLLKDLIPIFYNENYNRISNLEEKELKNEIDSFSKSLSAKTSNMFSLEYRDLIFKLPCKIYIDTIPDNSF